MWEDDDDDEGQKSWCCCSCCCCRLWYCPVLRCCVRLQSKEVTNKCDPLKSGGVRVWTPPHIPTVSASLQNRGLSPVTLDAPPSLLQCSVFHIPAYSNSWRGHMVPPSYLCLWRILPQTNCLKNKNNTKNNHLNNSKNHNYQLLTSFQFQWQIV